MLKPEMNTSCSKESEIEVIEIISTRAVSHSGNDNNGNQIIEERSLGGSEIKLSQGLCFSQRSVIIDMRSIFWVVLRYGTSNYFCNKLLEVVCHEGPHDHMWARYYWRPTLGPHWDNLKWFFFLFLNFKREKVFTDSDFKLLS